MAWGKLSQVKDRELASIIYNKALSNYRRVTTSGCWEYTRHIDKGGYGKIRVGKVMAPVHVVAWVANHDIIQGGLVVMHKCDNPSCFNPNHLMLGTQSENTADRFWKGREYERSGEKNHQAKISEGDVKDIFRLRSSGMKQKDIAAIYGVHPTHISSILTGKSWGHLGLVERPSVKVRNKPKSLSIKLPTEASARDALWNAAVRLLEGEQNG